MINDTEAAVVLLHDLPELSQSNPHQRSVSIYKTVQAFAHLTYQKIADHNYKAAKHCFVLADLLHNQGSQAVRCAIENVFVFALDDIFAVAKRDRVDARELMPARLYGAYVHQLNQYGC